MIQSQTEYERNQTDRSAPYSAQYGAAFTASEIPGDAVQTPGPAEVPEGAQGTPAQAWAALERAQAEQTVCTGTVAGIEDLSGYRPAVLVDWQGLPVYIPARKMFCRSWPEGQKMPQALRDRLARYLGAAVDFIPTKVYPRDHVAMGDRRSAMARMQRDYYEAQTVQPGSLATCRVLAVERQRVLAELFGVETWIPADQLSWAWVQDARDVCQPGDTLPCKVLAAEKTARDAWMVTVSCTAVSDPPDKVMLERMRRAGLYLGTVLEFQGEDVRVRLRAGVNCLCERAPGMVPSPGDTVSVIISDVNLDRQMAQGGILELRPKRQPDQGDAYSQTARDPAQRDQYPQSQNPTNTTNTSPRPDPRSQLDSTDQQDPRDQPFPGEYQVQSSPRNIQERRY